MIVRSVECDQATISLFTSITWIFLALEASDPSQEDFPKGKLVSNSAQAEWYWEYLERL